MKQTAVEFLVRELINNNHLKSISSMKQIIEEAKDMEMTQITEAFDDGFENQCDADLYYNKKFKPDYKKQ